MATVITPHPFTRLNNPSRWEAVKMIWGLFTLIAPLRFFTFVLSLAVGVNIVLLFHFCGNKYWTVKSLRLVCRWLLFIAGYYWIPVVGEIVSPCPKIVVSNHMSNMEILHLLSLPFKDENQNPVVPTFVMKESIFLVPFVGAICRDVLGCIGVSRRTQIADGDRATTKVTKSATEKIVEWVGKERQDGRGPLAIFPEGTTTNGTCLLAFKTGAFAPMTDILPIIYSLPKKKGCFTPTYESIWSPVYIWRLMSEPIQHMTCEILEPISPPGTIEIGRTSEVNVASHEKDRTACFAERVRLTMAKHSHLPLVSDEFDYCHKLKYHGRLRHAYERHPKGPLFAMCFEPVQRVLSEIPIKDESRSKIGKGDETIKYDTILGITVDSISVNVAKSKKQQ